MGVATGSKRYCDDPTPSVAGASTPKNAQLPRKKSGCSVPLPTVLRMVSAEIAEIIPRRFILFRAELPGSSIEIHVAS